MQRKSESIFNEAQNIKFKKKKIVHESYSIKSNAMMKNKDIGTFSRDWLKNNKKVCTLLALSSLM